MALAGAIVGIAHGGTLEVRRRVVRPEYKKARKKSLDQKEATKMTTNP